MNAPAITLPRLDGVTLGFAACSIGAAAIVAWMCVSVNVERSCATHEKLLPSCAQTATGTAEESQALRARIARDPGDANAYTQLALSDRSELRPRIVDVASRLAPREPNLLLAQAAAAMDRKDWAAAVPPLVQLADQRDVLVAAQALASLVLDGHADLLAPHLRPHTMWLQHMILQMRGQGMPMSGALPLVVHAMQLGVIDVETARAYVRDLKARGAWADAHALWMSMHGTSVPLLFNAGFDRAFELDGFDWEVPPSGSTRRAGVIVARRRAEQRGAVLELQFNARPVTQPIVRQYLFIAPGRYRLHGDYVARQFRMEDGLVWVVRCASKASAGVSTPLRDTLGLWQSFDFDFKVPADCGTVASLQLETSTPADAALGARGRVSFDAFALERTGS
jgi:hypothetical protein